MYIYDLFPDRSLVKYLRAQGFELYMIDWGAFCTCIIISSGRLLSGLDAKIAGTGKRAQWHREAFLAWLGMVAVFALLHRVGR